MIQISHAEVTFETTRVYSDLTLTINSGEFVAILGKSGCGKSVLLKSILNNVPLSSGSILINGKPIVNKSKIMSVVYQDHSILPWLTLRNNIKLVTNDSEVIESFSEMLQITEHLDKLPKHVSIGTKQRAAIVRALCAQTDIILLDEPLCSVDEITAQEIRASLKSVFAGKTVLYVTHNIHEALYVADRIIVLNSGNVILDQPSKDLTYQCIFDALSA